MAKLMDSDLRSPQGIRENNDIVNKMRPVGRGPPEQTPGWFDAGPPQQKDLKRKAHGSTDRQLL
jgi:hypothetical protein